MAWMRILVFETSLSRWKGGLNLYIWELLLKLVCRSLLTIADLSKEPSKVWESYF